MNDRELIESLLKRVEDLERTVSNLRLSTHVTHSHYHYPTMPTYYGPSYSHMYIPYGGIGAGPQGGAV